MKFKKIMLVGGLVALAIKAGDIMGRAKCLIDMADKAEDQELEKGLSIDLTKKYQLTLTKKSK